MAKDYEYKESHEKDEDESSSISLKDLIVEYLHRWYWFAISAILCLGLGAYYLLKTPKVYTTSAELLVKETSGKKSMGDFGTFGSFDLFQQKSNINNEMATLDSPDLMGDVVRMLNLNVQCTVDGTFHPVVLYGTTLPVNVYINSDSITVDDARSITFDLRFTPDQQVTLSDFRVNGEKTDYQPVTGTMTNPIESPVGVIAVTPAQAFPGEFDKVGISWVTPEAAVKYFSRELAIDQEDEKSSVINIAVRDVNTQRAKDIISSLITVYNKKWVDDKNQIAQSTSNFISERLAVIESELGNVDNEISTYKSENLVPDIAAASDMYMKQANEANSQILALSNQLEMANMVRRYLVDPDKKFQLLPVNTGFENATIASQMNNYNQKVLDRNSIVSNSSETNPIVLDMDQALSEMRSSIVSSIDNQIEALRGQIRTQERQQGQAISHISSNPQQAKYLLTVERQQMVKENLYLFLLQKREENELSQAFTAYNTRVIAQPCVADRVTPVNRNVLLMALIIGLLIPAVIFYLKMVLSTKVRGRKDLEKVLAPFAGEVPSAERKKFALPFLKKKMGENEAAPLVLVKEGSRDIMNEAFRVVRANLEFMMGDKGRVVAVTSFNPGSGKTFITFNLAVSMALKDKRVIAVDLDLRKGSLSRYAGKEGKGITDYIIGRTDDIDSLIVRDAAGTRLDVLTMGTMPPNPTELLYTDRFRQVIDHLRQEYDLVLLDCPPAEIVADAQIINQEADFTLFIVRAGLLEREMLTELNDFYKSGRYKNITVLLNGTDAKGGRYGRRYGYRYGYGYGSYGGYTSSK